MTRQTWWLLEGRIPSRFFRSWVQCSFLSVRPCAHKPGQGTSDIRCIASFHIGTRITAIAWSSATVSPRNSDNWSIQYAVCLFAWVGAQSFQTRSGNRGLRPSPPFQVFRRPRIHLCLWRWDERTPWAHQRHDLLRRVGRGQFTLRRDRVGRQNAHGLGSAAQLLPLTTPFVVRGAVALPFAHGFPDYLVEAATNRLCHSVPPPAHLHLIAPSHLERVPRVRLQRKRIPH